jgi:hypothetical protein
MMLFKRLDYQDAGSIITNIMMIITILGIEVKDDNVGEESQASEVSLAKTSNSIGNPQRLRQLFRSF